MSSMRDLARMPQLSTLQPRKVIDWSRIRQLWVSWASSSTHSSRVLRSLSQQLLSLCLTGRISSQTALQGSMIGSSMRIRSCQSWKLTRIRSRVRGNPKLFFSFSYLWLIPQAQLMKKLLHSRELSRVVEKKTLRLSFCWLVVMMVWKTLQRNSWKISTI